MGLPQAVAPLTQQARTGSLLCFERLLAPWHALPPCAPLVTCSKRCRFVTANRNSSIAHRLQDAGDVLQDGERALLRPAHAKQAQQPLHARRPGLGSMRACSIASELSSKHWGSARLHWRGSCSPRSAGRARPPPHLPPPSGPQSAPPPGAARCPPCERRSLLMWGACL